MVKKNKFSQLAILSAGTFANVLTCIFFFIVLLLFFSFAFSSSGVVYDTYPYAILGVSGISMVNGISIDNPSYEEALKLMNDEGLNKIIFDGNSFVATKEFL